MTGAAFDHLDVAIGARIRMRRKQLGLSQERLGDALGVTFQQIQKYERGANRLSASSLVRVAEVLELPASALLGEGEPDGLNGLWSGDLDASDIALIEGLRQVRSKKVRQSLLLLIEQLQQEEGEAAS